MQVKQQEAERDNIQQGLQELQTDATRLRELLQAAETNHTSTTEQPSPAVDDLFLTDDFSELMDVGLHDHAGELFPHDPGMHSTAGLESHFSDDLPFDQLEQESTL